MPNHYSVQKTPLGFPNSTIIPGATLQSDHEIWRHTQQHKNTCEKDLSAKIKSRADAIPAMVCSQEVKQIYVNSEHEKIKSLKERIREDVERINKKIRDKGETEFRVIESVDKQRYYVAYDAKASVWIYCRRNKCEKNVRNEDADAKQTSIVQVGKYVAGAQVAGIVHYEFTHNATGDASCHLSFVVAKLMQKALKRDIRNDQILHMIVDKPLVYDNEDEQNCLMTIIKELVPDCVTRCVLRMAVFLLTHLLNWTFKKYSVKLGIFNWSTEHSLGVSDCLLDNAIMTHNERNVETDGATIAIPKAVVKTPPEFQPPTALDSVCHYTAIFFANHYNLLIGCGFALKFEIDPPKLNDKGFLYAFECTRFDHNRQQAREISKSEESPKQYYNTLELEKEWNENPRKFSISAQGIPVTITLNALIGSHCYYPLINFGHKDQ